MSEESAELCCDDIFYGYIGESTASLGFGLSVLALAPVVEVNSWNPRRGQITPPESKIPYLALAGVLEIPKTPKDLSLTPQPQAPKPEPLNLSHRLKAFSVI